MLHDAACLLLQFEYARPRCIDTVNTAWSRIIVMLLILLAATLTSRSVHVRAFGIRPTTNIPTTIIAEKVVDQHLKCATTFERRLSSGPLILVG